MESDKGRQILDHYYATCGLEGREPSWESLNAFLAETSYVHGAVKTRDAIDAAAWRLYEAQLKGWLGKDPFVSSGEPVELPEEDIIAIFFVGRKDRTGGHILPNRLRRKEFDRFADAFRKILERTRDTGDAGRIKKEPPTGSHLAAGGQLGQERAAPVQDRTVGLPLYLTLVPRPLGRRSGRGTDQPPAHQPVHRRELFPKAAA